MKKSFMGLKAIQLDVRYEHVGEDCLIADYIEPGRRELPNMADVRQLAFRDIDECLYRILKDSLDIWIVRILQWTL